MVIRKSSVFEFVGNALRAERMGHNYVNMLKKKNYLINRRLNSSFFYVFSINTIIKNHSEMERRTLDY